MMMFSFFLTLSGRSLAMSLQALPFLFLLCTSTRCMVAQCLGLQGTHYHRSAKFHLLASSWWCHHYSSIVWKYKQQKLAILTWLQRQRAASSQVKFGIRPSDALQKWSTRLSCLVGRHGTEIAAPSSRKSKLRIPGPYHYATASCKSLVSAVLCI